MGKNDISWQDILQAAKSNFASTESEPEEQPKEETKPANRTVLDITFEKKGRGGKTATIISGFEISDEEIKELASKMKAKLGTGGSARGGEILIQGDRRKDVLEYLKTAGFKARII